MKATIFTLIIEDDNESTGLFVDAKVFTTKKDALIELQKNEELFSKVNSEYEIEINESEKCISHYLFNDSNYILLTIKENEINL